jgi:hypothetical protein
MRLASQIGVADSIGHTSDALSEGLSEAASTHRKIEIVGVGASRRGFVQRNSGLSKAWFGVGH